MAALWTRLRAALRRWTPGRLRAARALPARASGGLAAGASPIVTPGAIEAVPEAMTPGAIEAVPEVMTPGTVDNVPEVMAHRTAAPGPAAPEVALVVEEAPPRAGRRRAQVTAAPTWGPEVGLMRVRQFFGRIVMTAPGAAEVDLGAWQGLTVERFFLAIGSPRALSRREPPTGGGEAMSLGNAFEGFEWD